MHFLYILIFTVSYDSFIFKHHSPGYRRPNFSRPSMSYYEAQREFDTEVIEVESTTPSYTPLEMSPTLHDGKKNFSSKNSMNVETIPSCFTSLEKEPKLLEVESFAQYQHIFKTFDVKVSAPSQFYECTNVLKVCTKFLIFYLLHSFLKKLY